MNNNDNDYVGIDERYKPKNEGNNTNVTNKEADRERVKKVGKFLIGGYLFWIVLVAGIMVVMMVFVFSMFNKAIKMQGDMFDKVGEMQGNVGDTFDSVEERQQEMNNNAKQQQDEMKNSYNVTAHNNKFEMYIGTEAEIHVKALIDAIIKNNKTNTDIIMTVVYDGAETTDVDEILDIKTKLVEYAEYEVIADYDSNGYITTITIRK